MKGNHSLFFLLILYPLSSSSLLQKKRLFRSALLEHSILLPQRPPNLRPQQLKLRGVRAARSRVAENSALESVVASRKGRRDAQGDADEESDEADGHVSVCHG